MRCLGVQWKRHISFPWAAQSGQASLVHAFRLRDRLFPEVVDDPLTFPLEDIFEDPADTFDFLGGVGDSSGSPSPQIGCEPLRVTRLCRATLSQFILVIGIPLRSVTTDPPLR